MNIIKKIFVLSVILFLANNIYGAESKLAISENGRFLVYKESGAPFFLTFDTGWGIFELISKEDAEIYLQDRKDKGFNGFLGCLIFPFGNPTAMLVTAS